MEKDYKSSSLIDKKTFEEIESELKALKKSDAREYRRRVGLYKNMFAQSSNIQALNLIALLFSSLGLHSSVGLILEKLKDKRYEKNGGTLIYALKGLRKK